MYMSCRHGEDCLSFSLFSGFVEGGNANNLTLIITQLLM
jgi:hypothetical protein